MNKFESINYYMKNYNLYKNIYLGGKKRYVGDTTNKVCRFCGKTDKETTFKQRVHAVPEYLGNKVLFSNFECDECNQKFSNTLEDHLGNYIGLFRTSLQIAGKRGVPKYKKGTDNIFTKDKTLVVTSQLESNMVNMDIENREFTITGISDPYIPLGIYKCLYKIFLSLLNEEDLVNFNWALDWICEEDYNNTEYNIKPAIVYQALIPGPKPYEKPYIVILKRKPHFEFKVPYRVHIPYYMMIMFIDNLAFQLPIFKVDEFNTNNKMTIEICPLQFDLDDNIRISKYGTTIWHRIDLSSNEIKKGSLSKITFKFEQCIENDEAYHRAHELLNK